MKRPQQVLISVVILVAIVTTLVVIVVQPVFYFNVTHELVGPEEDEAFSLLYRGASLDEIKAAVRASGKQVDQIEWMSTSLLSAAMEKQRTELAVWLLEQGADPNGIHPGSSPLRYAIRNEDTSMVELLLDYGADPDLDMGGNLTPREIAIHDIKNPDILQILDRYPPGGKE